MEKIVTAAVKEYVSVVNRLIIDEIIDCSYELTEENAEYFVNNYVSIDTDFCQIIISNNKILSNDRMICGKAIFEALENLSNGIIFESMSMNIDFKTDTFRATITLEKDILLKWYYTTIK